MASRSGKAFDLLKHCLLAALACAVMAAPCHAQSDPMRFTVDVQPSAIGDKAVSAAVYASGSIDPGATERFKEAIAAARVTDAVVYFDSGGGVVIESIKLGQAIRRFGFGTAVERPSGSRERATCASACVYSYAGGVARYYDEATGRLGVHQYSAAAQDGGKADDLKVAQLLGSVVVAHLHEMGVSSALYVAAAMTDSTGMLWLNHKEAASFDLVNDGVLPATADLRLAEDGHPYLLLSQVADRGQTLVTIDCRGTEATLSAGATGDDDMFARLKGQSLRSYVTLDGAPIPSDAGKPLEAIGTSLATTRSLDRAMLQRLPQANTMGLAVEEMGGRWNRTVDTTRFRERIGEYLRACRMVR